MDLIILRGIPGSGKTTFGELISEVVVSADDYFVDSNGNYNFNPNKLGAAHKQCYNRVELAMKSSDDKIVVANTFTTEKELKPYLTLADEYGYRVTSLIVENRHGSESIHDVPSETIDKMKKRFSIRL